MVGVVSYIFVLVTMGLKIAVQENVIRYAATVPIVYLVEHLSYTIGFWIGLLTLQKVK
jgi:hypothetical protein